MKQPVQLLTMSAVALVITLGSWTTMAAGHSGRVIASERSVRLCTSAPAGLPAVHDVSQGIFNAVTLATRVWQKRYSSAHLHLVPPLVLDYGQTNGHGYSPEQEKQNALACLARTDTLGYIGPLNSSAAFLAEPILNEGGMVTISPSNTNPNLTSPRHRGALEPLTYQHILPYRTYYRTVATDVLQGPSAAAFMKTRLGVQSYYLVDDYGFYGRPSARLMDAYARHTLGMHRVGFGHVDPTNPASVRQSADALSDTIVSHNPAGVYCGCFDVASAQLARLLRQKGYRKPFLGLDQLVDNQVWIDSVGPSTSEDYATQADLDWSRLPRSFQRAYRSAFHGPVYAYLGSSYDAAGIVLQAIFQATRAGKLRGSLLQQREAVTGYVSRMSYRGVTGVTTFDKNGDTTNRNVSVYTVRGTHWEFAGLAPRVRGVPSTS